MRARPWPGCRTGTSKTVVWPTTRPRGCCGGGLPEPGSRRRVLIFGWRTARWWRRGAALLAVPLCLLSAALTLNLWVGYFPTVQTAWDQLTAGPLPDQADAAGIAAMAAAGLQPTHGSVVPVAIPRRRVAFQTPRRSRLPAACLVRHQSPAAAADRDDDRWRVQHARPTGCGRATPRRRSTTWRPRTEATRRCSSSWIPVERSTTTPNASTAFAATRPIT